MSDKKKRTPEQKLHDKIVNLYNEITKYGSAFSDKVKNTKKEIHDVAEELSDDNLQEVAYKKLLSDQFHGLDISIMKGELVSQYDIYMDIFNEKQSFPDSLSQLINTIRKELPKRTFVYIPNKKEFKEIEEGIINSRIEEHKKNGQIEHVRNYLEYTLNNGKDTK